MPGQNMNRLFYRLLTICMLSTLAGCAAPKVTAVPGDSVYVNTRLQEPVQDAPQPEVITLECQAAHKLGCRFKGRLYPWNAWVEKQGYTSNEYTIQDVRQAGSKAVVTLIKK